MRRRVRNGRKTELSRHGGTRHEATKGIDYATPKSTGKRTTTEEVGVYTVKNDKITREQFFFDGER